MITSFPSPSVRISPNGFTFNAACMNLMPDVDYVQFMHNFKCGQLFAMECGATDEDKTPWRLRCSSREVRVKRTKWPKFYQLICNEMNWLIGNEYTLPASLQEFEGKRIVFFHLADSTEGSSLWNLKMSDLQSADVDEEPPLTFRFAGRDDCALILRFIRELAAYEHMEKEVVTTEDLLSEWLFDKRTAEVLFAVSDGQEVGFALFFPNFSTFLGRAGLYLEDLYVLPEYRGRGIGTAMLRELARVAVERGYGRFEWSCLDWNTPSVEFYLSLGAEQMSDWTGYRLAGEALTEFAKGG